ncbi:MAG: metal ABC transporter permease [Lachnospiraceae bacterium]|nr:metal ABC transporter permease [Lachnospiraceae bacterium]MBR4994033.1 metal ABC transporter permease [Lachnospiraceae bacterium]MBR5945055.1 metal ABC transporter permease [Lachnospiraceae bacterium]
MIDSLVRYFEFPFVRYAVIVGVLIALCSSLIGVTLVLKRYSFIGDGLSHVAFGAMAIAMVLHFSNNTFLVLPVTIVVAIVLLKSGAKARIKGDAAIAMMSVGALAFGYMLLNVFSVSSNVSGDVCSTLFGSMSILTLKPSEVWLCGVLSLLVIVFFILFYNRIFAVTFDENFMDATGQSSKTYNYIIAIITSVIIVLGMNLVGSLLISALIVFPALSAMRIIKSFKAVVIASAVISVVCALLGMLISIIFSTPVGSTIVIMDAAAFLICHILGIIRER